MSEPLEQLRSKCLDGFCRLCISCEAAVSAALAPQPIDDAALREAVSGLFTFAKLYAKQHELTDPAPARDLIERALGEGRGARLNEWAQRGAKEAAQQRCAELEAREAVWRELVALEAGPILTEAQFPRYQELRRDLGLDDE